MLSWSGLKKRPIGSAAKVSELVVLIEPAHPTLSIARQTEMLGIARRSYYYQPVVSESELARLKLHMDAIDEIYTAYPFYGTRRMQVELEHEHSIYIGRDRIRHLMRRLGLEAIYPKPNTSKAAPHNQTYPYLLKGLAITRPNQVWGTDITYIRTAVGFVYLVAFLTGTADMWWHGP